MKRLAFTLFMSVFTIGAYALQNRGRMSDLSNNYGGRDNEFLIPLVMLLLFGGFILIGLIKGKNNK